MTFCQVWKFHKISEIITSNWPIRSQYLLQVYSKMNDEQYYCSVSGKCYSYDQDWLAIAVSDNYNFFNFFWVPKVVNMLHKIGLEITVLLDLHTSPLKNKPATLSFVHWEPIKNQGRQRWSTKHFNEVYTNLILKTP